MRQKISASPALASHGLDRLLDSVVTSDRTPQRKPHPLELCCRELNVDADEDAWYVGDFRRRLPSRTRRSGEGLVEGVGEHGLESRAGRAS